MGLATAKSESAVKDNACQTEHNEDDDIWNDFDNTLQKVNKPTKQR